MQQIHTEYLKLWSVDKNVGLAVQFDFNLWIEQNFRMLNYDSLCYFAKYCTFLFCSKIKFRKKYSDLLFMMCLSGGHGWALAGVFVEAARFRAAEAPWPSAETGIWGDCASMWVLFANVLMLSPADSFFFLNATLSECTICIGMLLSACLDQYPF